MRLKFVFLLGLLALILGLNACGMYVAVGRRSPGWIDNVPAQVSPIAPVATK